MIIEDSHAWGRRLLRAWAILATLTLVSVASAMVAPHDQRVGLVSVSVALVASFIKARQVLDHFLDLRRAGSGWRTGFNVLLLVILGLCFSLYVAALMRS